MVLSGLTFSSWQAWLEGVYFVRKPWGLPKATGFCSHPYVFYAFTCTIVSYLFWIDCQLKLFPISNKMSFVERLLAEAIVFVMAIFDLYFRFSFYRLNYKLADLLCALEEPKYQPLNVLFRKCWKFHKISKWALSMPRYIIALTLVCAYANITASYYPDSEFFIPRNWYFILFAIFSAFPHVTTIIFAYDLIVVTTMHMLWTFEDYCAHLEDHIYKGCFLRKRHYSLNPTPSVASLQLPSTGGRDYVHSKHVTKSCENGPSSEFRNIKRLSDAEEGKGFEKVGFNCFVERFDWINGLAEKYDRAIGPIILGVVVRCVFGIVHSINAILLKTGEPMNLKAWNHVLILFVEASQLVILKLGSEVHERISYWKGKLTKAWLLTTSGSTHTNPSEKSALNRLNTTLDSEDRTVIIDDVEYDSQLVQDLVNYVCMWNWKVSAAGIFNIDKSLLSGIVSTTLTYVIILFQLNLAEPGTGGQGDEILGSGRGLDLFAANLTTY